MVAGVLQRAGYRVLTAPDGESAWSLLQREQVDLVCSDVEMPHLDGIGLTERVRARGLAVPVILLTSLGAEADRERGAQAGASGYVVKQDFDPAGFLGQVRSLMQERVQGRAG
jgi:two-component system, chemotaxis family, sensor kinase CheA